MFLILQLYIKIYFYTKMMTLIIYLNLKGQHFTNYLFDYHI